MRRRVAKEARMTFDMAGRKQRAKKINGARRGTEEALRKAKISPPPPLQVRMADSAVISLEKPPPDSVSALPLPTAVPVKDRASYDGDTAIKLYLREIGLVKLLTPDQEIELADKIKKGDK